MTLRSCGVRMSPLSMPTLSEIDVNDVASVSTNEFSSPGVLCDDQISTQTKKGKYSGHLSQQNESITQEHLAGIFLRQCIEIVTLSKSKLDSQSMVRIILVQLLKRPTVIPLNYSKLCGMVKFYALINLFIWGKY